MKQILLSILLITLAFPAYAAPQMRVVYSIESAAPLSDVPTTRHNLWSLRITSGLNGSDDRMIFGTTQPNDIRSVVEFPIDDRILIIQEHSDRDLAASAGLPVAASRIIITAQGKDVTSAYPKKYFENDPQLGTRLQSPNRKLVAFVKYPDVGDASKIKPHHVYVRNQKTKALRDYTHVSFPETRMGGIYPIAWSPDNKFLYVQSGSYEGPSQIRLWRITLSNGAIYEYRSLEGIESFGFSINTNTTFALGTRSRNEGMSSAPPSEIVRIDLKQDKAKVLRKSATSVFMKPVFVNNNETILFDEQKYQEGAVVQETMVVRQLNLRTGQTKVIGKKGALSTIISDGRWLVYEQQYFDQDGNNNESEFRLVDLLKGTDRPLARDNNRRNEPICPDPKAASASALCEKQRVHIIGIFSE